MPVTEVQSAAFDMRDAFYNVVTADPFFANFTWRKNKWLPVLAELVPYLGVYFVNEVRTPDGDANAGCIRFSHAITIGFSVVLSGNDQAVLEQNVDQAQHRIDIDLWTNYSLMNVLHNNNPENVGIEAVPRATRRHVFGSARANNEFPFIELECNFTGFCRTEWYPDITDTLNEIDVTVAPNNVNVDWPTMANPEVEPIDIVYELSSSRQRQQKRRPWLLARDQRRRNGHG